VTRRRKKEIGEAMPEFETDTLLELVGEKHDCLLHLNTMGEKQAELIQPENMTGLLDLLAAKQRLLLKLRAVEKRLDPFRSQDPEQRRWRSIESRQLCAEKLKECEAILVKIISREKGSEDELTRRRDAAANRLQGAHTAGIARGAYSAEKERQNNQLDISSDT
jgi:hypothetical protein